MNKATVFQSITHYENAAYRLIENARGKLQSHADQLAMYGAAARAAYGEPPFPTCAKVTATEIMLTSLCEIRNSSKFIKIKAKTFSNR